LGFIGGKTLLKFRQARFTTLTPLWIVITRLSLKKKKEERKRELVPLKFFRIPEAIIHVVQPVVPLLASKTCLEEEPLV